MLQRTSLLQGLAACACVVASIVAVACGSKDKASSTVASTGASLPNIVQSDDLNRVDKDSPDRALLNWFQAVQFGDVVAVRQLTAPATLTKITPAVLDHAVRRIGASLARPQIVGSRITPTSAVMHVLLLSYYPDSPKPVASTPSSFTLARIRGTWLLTDVSVLFPRSAPRRKPFPEAPPKTTPAGTTTTP